MRIRVDDTGMSWNLLVQIGALGLSFHVWYAPIGRMAIPVSGFFYRQRA